MEHLPIYLGNNIVSSELQQESDLDVAFSVGHKEEQSNLFTEGNG
jgi:hypothetical protein